VGYWCFVGDPDGHTVEFAFGQHVGAALARAPVPAKRDATGRAW
jgi:hypothetical protein